MVSGRFLRRFQGWLIWLGLAVAVLYVPSQAFAQESYTRVTGVRLVPSESAQGKSWAMSAEFDIRLSLKLEEAASRGLPLKFSVDFKLLEPRWYWSDREVVLASYPITLSYHALTRTYRLSSPKFSLTAASLEDVVDAMTHLSDWEVISENQVQMGRTYLAQVRFRLDVAELPKPFQINAFTNSQWLLSSDWLEFEFTPRGETLN